MKGVIEVGQYTEFRRGNAVYIAITWFYTVQDIRTLRLPLCVSVTRKWVRPAAEQKDHQQEKSQALHSSVW